MIPPGNKFKQDIWGSQPYICVCVCTVQYVKISILESAQRFAPPSDGRIVTSATSAAINHSTVSNDQSENSTGIKLMIVVRIIRSPPSHATELYVPVHK